MPQITGGTTEVTITLDLSALGASLNALGNATVTGTVATFPITGGSTSSTGDLIEHNGSGLRITGTNPTTTVDTQNYLVNTGSEVVNADVSINGASQGNLGLFTLGSSGLSNVPLTLTSSAVTTINTAFGLSGMNALTTSTPIGTLTSSPIVK